MGKGKQSRRRPGDCGFHAEIKVVTEGSPRGRGVSSEGSLCPLHGPRRPRHVEAADQLGCCSHAGERRGIEGSGAAEKSGLTVDAVEEGRAPAGPQGQQWVVGYIQADLRLSV